MKHQELSDIWFKAASGGLQSSVLSAAQEAAKKAVASWAKEFVKLCNTLTPSDLSIEDNPLIFRKGTFTLKKVEVSSVFKKQIEVTIEYAFLSSYQEMKITYSIGGEKLELEYAWRSNRVRLEAKSPKEVFQAFIPGFGKYLASRI